MKISLLVLIVATGLRPAAQAAPVGFTPWSVSQTERGEAAARVNVPRVGFLPWHKPGRGPVDVAAEARPAFATRTHGFNPWLKPDV